MWVLLYLVLAFVLVVAPIWAIARILSMGRDIRRLLGRIEDLEGRLTRVVRAVREQDSRTPDAAEAEALPLPETLPPPPPRPSAWQAFDTPTIASMPAVDRVGSQDEAPEPGAVVAVPAPAALAAPSPVSSPAPGPARSLEQQFGGIWLQNIGAVLLLLGVFFMILWGYTTGRFGPEVIVAAGVGMGLVLAWRGDRMSRQLPRLGHTFIGVGLGVIYLSLYLGHFTLRVLPAWLAFGLLTLVSFASILTGLRYRAQAIAALGVLGAFVPQFLAAWVPLKGFPMTPAGLVAYLAVVNLVVFGLAIRPGWSGLNLTSLLLGTFTWTFTFTGPTWGWGVEIALAALFALLGLGPVPRLARTTGPVRIIDQAIVAVAPLCLIAASWPMLAYSPRIPVAMLLFALAALYVGAASWVDARRPDQDLWRPLTGAATLFLTAALQRAVGTQNTPMAWCGEGALLVALGMSERGAWLRFCGYVVTGVGGLWMLGNLFFAPWDHHALPVFYAAGIRDLLCLGAVLAGSWVLGRGRAQLSERERFVPEIWTAAGQLMFMMWAGREANHLAYALEGSGGRWQRVPAVTAPAGDLRRDSLAAALVGAAWLAQASTLLLMTVRPGRAFLRLCGYLLSMVAALRVLTGLGGIDGWSNDQIPVLYPAGTVNLAAVLGLVVLAARLSRRRATLAGEERRMPEFWTVVAGVLTLAWTAREADHLARALEGIPGMYGRTLGDVDPAARARVHVLAAAFTSVGWLAQAIVLLVLGWVRDSSFLRWTGLVLFGLTVLKFLAYDLQTVDVFWRFLTAIVVGAALLAVSYAYQRRNRAASAG